MPPTIVHVDERKWPDQPHWHFDTVLLGEDEHGTWLFVPADTVIQRGTESPRLAGREFLVLVSTATWWIVEFYRDHPHHDIYVNIGTTPEWQGNRVTQVDLDLDVVLRGDGSVAVLDEDEFATNQVNFTYPPELVTGARQAANKAVDLLSTGREPFAQAADPWWLRAHRITDETRDE